MSTLDCFLAEHRRLTRRFFLGLGAAGTAALAIRPRVGQAAPDDPLLAKAIAELESFFTLQQNFRDVSRGKPLPHSLPDDKKHEVGLTRETWKLEIISDP